MCEKNILSHDAKEYEFLNLSFNRFLDLYSEILDDDFINLESELKFYKIKDAFCIYAELLSYTPIKEFVDNLRKIRPPMEAELSSDFLKFIRNILIHFPFFKTWNEVYITKKIVNWDKDGMSVDKFLNKYVSHSPIEYRFWSEKKKKMTYVTVTFPIEYEDNKIYLKNIIDENDGIRFCIILMHKVLMSQVIEINNSK